MDGTQAQASGAPQVQDVLKRLPSRARPSFLALLEQPPAQAPVPQRPESGANPLPEAAPRVIGIGGEPRAGKDELIDQLVRHYAGIARLNFSDVIIAEANELLLAAGLPEIHEGNKSDPAPRRFLQDLGLGRRDETGLHYWADTIGELAEQLLREHRLVIIAGLRDESDFVPVRRWGGETWGVVRPGNLYRADHPIESGFSELSWDRIILNDREGEPERMFEQAKRFLETPLKR